MNTIEDPDSITVLSIMEENDNNNHTKSPIIQEIIMSNRIGAISILFIFEEKKLQG